MIILYVYTTYTDKIRTASINQLRYSHKERRHLSFEILPAKREVANTTEQISDYRAMVLNLGSTDPLEVHGQISEGP
jgi:hypothetical protein